MATKRFITICTLFIAVSTGYADSLDTQQVDFSSIRSWMKDDFTVPKASAVSNSSEYVGVVLRHHGKILGYVTGTTIEDACKDAFGQMRRMKVVQKDTPRDVLENMLDSVSIELESC